MKQLITITILVLLTFNAFSCKTTFEIAYKKDTIIIEFEPINFNCDYQAKELIANKCRIKRLVKKLPPTIFSKNSILILPKHLEILRRNGKTIFRKKELKRL